MAKFQFAQATKQAAKARIALAGPSGSGKTFTGLRIARGLGGQRIGVVDTEHGSAAKYADLFDFQHLVLTSYAPSDLVEVCAAAAEQGIDVLFIDSLTHFWSGVDGMLEQVDRSAKRSSGGNQFGGWKDERPKERQMIEAMLGFPGHVIVSMRVKTAYEVVENERGKKVPQKIGLKPEQRDGIEYEFDVVGDLDVEHTMIVSKTRCPQLSGAVLTMPGEEMAADLLAWLSDGTKAPNATELRDKALAATTMAEARAVWTEAKSLLLLGAVITTPEGAVRPLGDWIAAHGASLQRDAPAAVPAPAEAEQQRAEQPPVDAPAVEPAPTGGSWDPAFPDEPDRDTSKPGMVHLADEPLKDNAMRRGLYKALGEVCVAKHLDWFAELDRFAGGPVERVQTSDLRKLLADLTERPTLVQGELAGATA